MARILFLAGSALCLFGMGSCAEPETKVVKYASPVQRVVALLQKMKAQLEAEASNEAEMYDKMVCWCETNEKEKTKAISDADVKTSDLEAEIGVRSGRLGGLASEIENLKGQIAKDEASLKTATAIREKGAAAFSAEEVEMMQAITNLKNAIIVLSRHHGDSSMLQLESPALATVRAVLRDVSLKYELLLGDSPRVKRGSLRSAALLQSDAPDTTLFQALGAHAADALPVNLAERLLAQAASEAPAQNAFVQSHAAQPDTFKSYSPQSSQIFGVLNQMKDEFESNLSQAQKDELKARADFEALAKSKTAQISSGKEKLDVLETEHADNMKALADAKEDFELTRAQRTADVEFLSNLRLTCQSTDKQWSERSATRSEELRAVAEGIAILTEDDARDHLAKTVTLLQEVSNVNSAAGVLRSRAAASLRHAAHGPDFEADDLLSAWHGRDTTETPRSQLATLAVSVELDTFTQVKAAMDKMIADLNEQQAEEVKSKAYCVKELDDTEKATYHKNEGKEDLEATMDTLAATVSKLNSELESAKKEISDTQVAIKAASETREKENAEFQSVVSDQRVAQDILQKALDRLELFYKKNTKPEGALIQKAKQEPPVKFNTYKKNSGSNPVMGLIEQIIGDSKKLEGEAVAAEQSGQAEYETFVKDSNAAIAKLSEAVTVKSKGVASANMDTEAAKSEHESTVGELESLAAYTGDLHSKCDFLLKNFAIRQRSRLQEVEAIQAAKAILSGAQ